ncbi:MAG: hypothetical protein AAB797_02175 [Patescibacteria group bacterium]
MKLQVQKISLSEFDQLEKQIADNDQTLDQMYETWQSLDQFFHNASYETDAEFRLTYFRLYVRLTWKMLEVVDKDYFIKVVRQQAVMALLLDVDVLNSLMWYLGLNNADQKGLESLYLELKKVFLESEAVVGVWQGKNVTVAEVVKEIGSVYKTGDTLAKADFESRLRQIMFPDETAKKYFTADPEEAKERFLDLVSFFQTFTQENIWFVVDAFLNPEKYQNAAPEKAPTAIAPNVKAAPVVAPKSPSQPQVVPPKKEAPKLVVPPTIRPKPTPTQVKAQIESQFKKDVDGNFADIEGVMAKLSELAEKNNDSKIAEMIYYDEKENKFKWNI